MGVAWLKQFIDSCTGCQIDAVAMVRDCLLIFDVPAQRCVKSLIAKFLHSIGMIKHGTPAILQIILQVNDCLFVEARNRDT